jgi:hypothetical protein
MPFEYLIKLKPLFEHIHQQKSEYDAFKLLCGLMRQ